MGLKVRAAKMMGNRRALGLVSLLVAFTGVSMVLNPSHASELIGVGIGFLVAGSALLGWVLWPQPAVQAPITGPSLGARLIRLLTLRGRLIPLFPAFGIAVVVLDIAYNVFLSATPAFQTEDVLVQLSAAALILYGIVPKRYARERDFGLLFFLFLDLLLVVPLLVVRLVTQSFEASVDIYSWTALAPEVGAILSALGVSNTIHSVAGTTAPGLTFTPVHMGVPVTLVITTACSGIYSFGIFAAAYIAFLATEYTRPSRRLWLLLGLGFAASYVANLLRMTTIVLVGYHTDTVQSDLQNLLLAHSYAGWLIFIGWLALFWGVLFKTLPVDQWELSLRQRNPAQEFPRGRSACATCGESLSPAIPATRCQCGRFYHTACLATDGECPACHRLVPYSRLSSTGKT